MEKLFNKISNIDPTVAKKLNPQVLAFVGDGVYTLFIRSNLAVAAQQEKGSRMHQMATEYVKASGQSDVMEKLMPVLLPDELAVFKRARNYKTPSVAKHANIIDYKRATGFEALVGYLYLSGKIERLNEILNYSYEGE